MDKHRILFLAANPVGTDRLALDEEARAISIELEQSGHRDRFDFVTRWAAQPLDLLRDLRKLKPAVVHFSGHGSGHTALSHPDNVPGRDVAVHGSRHDSQDGLYFQGRDGGPQLVSAEALQKTFGAAGSSVRVVVLNACYSSAQAEALCEHIDCIVGVQSALHDDAARIFSIGFYGALGDGESVASAFANGCAAISLERVRDSDRPQLHVRTGVDAMRLILATGGDPSTTPAAHPPSISLKASSTHVLPTFGGTVEQGKPQTILDMSTDIYASATPEGEGMNVEFHASSNHAILEFMLHIDRYLAKQTFNSNEHKRTLVVVQELVCNVMMHSADPKKWCSVNIRHDQDKVEVNVADHGTGFDLDATIHRLLDELTRTDRERGLLRITRYGTVPRQHHSTLHRMAWYRRRDVPRHRNPSDSRVMLKRSACVPIDYIISYEDLIKIAESDTYMQMEMGVFGMLGDAFMIRIFEPLRRAAVPAILYTVTGTEPTWKLLVDYGPGKLLSQLLTFRASQTPLKKLVMLACAERETNRWLAERAKDVKSIGTRDFHFFEDEQACYDFLNQALDQP